VDNLQGQLTSTPMRRVTSERRSDNPQLEEKLKGDLLDLELKRTALLQKFKPTYRPVVEVDTQIAQTKAAIASMQKAPLQEQVTDADPTHDWIRNELAKAQAELSSLKARSVATAKSIQLYGDMAKNLDSKSLTQGDLEREVKAQEQNYLLYVKKQEEARITDALDKQRVVNVSLAEEPTNPILPVHSVLFYGLAVGLFFITLGAGTVYLKDRLDPSVRTATELEECLDLPILADVPRHRAALPAA